MSYILNKIGFESSYYLARERLGEPDMGYHSQLDDSLTNINFSMLVHGRMIP